MASDIELVRIASAGDRLVRLGQLVSLPISPAAFRRWEDEGRWLQVTPMHFRHATTELTFAMEVIAGSEWLGRRGALYAESALAWMEVLEHPPSHAEWLIPRTNRWIPHWTTIHTTTRWDKGDFITINGVRSSTATRAIIDFCASNPTAAACEAVIERAIALKRTSLPTLRKRLARLSGRGRHGGPLLRELLLDSGGESFLERRFLRLMRVHGVRRPETQVVFRRNGTHVARVDFLFRSADVVVEVSGRLGHVSDRDRQRDARRRNALQQSGMTVLEFTTADVIDDPAYVLASLHTSLSVTE